MPIYNTKDIVVTCNGIEIQGWSDASDIGIDRVCDESRTLHVEVCPLQEMSEIDQELNLYDES